MQISLVSTVFNESSRLEKTIADLESQTVKPSEIIITDAGSSDGTYEKLLEWRDTSNIPIIVLQKHRCNVAEGRNLAIRTAKYDIIASTDFGCRFTNKWLESITNPLLNPEVMVVGGSFSVIEADQNSLAAKAAYINNNGYNINVKAANFIPSSRSIAYRREVFDKIGGYCEWLTLAGDDFIFGLEVKASGYKILMVDEANVFWGRHVLPIGFLKEAGRYGLGEGEAKSNVSMLFKHLISLSFQVLFIVLLIFNITFYILEKDVNIIAIVINLMLAIGFKSYISTFLNWLRFRSEKYNFKVLIFAFYQQQMIKYYYIKSYLKGYFNTSERVVDNSIELKKRLNGKIKP
ncbi:hypothetical protein ASE74_00085 [Pedobacter sp. Leaf216]|uniref:glycosyltransferase n=1 Tax=Pedobacter sp. Leaf216 TaxID=1735684 RepID=UPI0006F66354|nr:glycosyltransferase [Pedobacter sp. Leaf216]KQM79020.1 hypothetical protein ASE74_00085 [Pedobacter sp. Leaf216]